ncbi:MAG: hypothetical protein FJY77_05305, partial [Candidatus Altiarchaeales archaeon]|nr:hypothetical protein [Candidatus Altiarchaeales archaeon]
MPRIVDREPRGKVVEDFATHTLMVVNKEADQMTPNQRLKLREEFRRKRKERQEAEIRERRKIAKVITGDEAKMLQLE